MENKMTPEQEAEMYRHRLEYLTSRIGSMTDHEQWEAVQEIKRLTAPHPAIPEEVRKTLDTLLECENIWRGDPSHAEFQAARAYLTSAPVATDKAVCPKCGHSESVRREYKSVCCCECGEVYPVQVLVISPPRTEKGGAK
jgi:Zn-dependent M32 family carboxypeptidase